MSFSSFSFCGEGWGEKKCGGGWEGGWILKRYLQVWTLQWGVSQFNKFWGHTSTPPSPPSFENLNIFCKKKKTGYQGWTLKVHDPFTPPFVETLHYGQDPVRYIEDINQYDVPDL
jgi:hypothetical protein